MKSFCILGLGRFGEALARTLAENGREVLVIDNDAKHVEDIADYVDSAVVGDATQEAVLRAAGVADYDCAVICMSENVNDSILSLILLKEIGVGYIIARAGSMRHAKVLEKIGADEIVYPETDLGVKMARRLSYDGVRQYIELSEDTAIAEIDAPEQWVGKNLIDLDVRKRLNINVLTVRRGNAKRGNSVDPTEKFRKDDTVTVMGSEKNILHLMERLKKG